MSQSVILSFIHSFIENINLSLSYSIIHLVSQSVSQSVIHSCIQSFSQSNIQSFCQLFSYSFIHSFTFIHSHAKRFAITFWCCHILFHSLLHGWKLKIFKILKTYFQYTEIDFFYINNIAEIFFFNPEFSINTENFHPCYWIL